MDDDRDPLFEINHGHEVLDTLQQSVFPRIFGAVPSIQQQLRHRDITGNNPNSYLPGLWGEAWEIMGTLGRVLDSHVHTITTIDRSRREQGLEPIKDYTQICSHCSQKTVVWSNDYIKSHYPSIDGLLTGDRPTNNICPRCVMTAVESAISH